MPPKENSVGYRRNGKKQACEPCRKGKLGCDHGAPFCGRCVRRKTTSKCIYHPAPMTRGRGPPAANVVLQQPPTHYPKTTVYFNSPPASANANPPFFSPPHSVPRDIVTNGAAPGYSSITVQTTATQTTNTPCSTTTRIR